MRTGGNLVFSRSNNQSGRTEIGARTLASFRSPVCEPRLFLLALLDGFDFYELLSVLFANLSAGFNGLGYKRNEFFVLVG